MRRLSIWQNQQNWWANLFYRDVKESNKETGDDINHHQSPFYFKHYSKKTGWEKYLWWESISAEIVLQVSASITSTFWCQLSLTLQWVPLCSVFCRLKDTFWGELIATCKKATIIAFNPSKSIRKHQDFKTLEFEKRLIGNHAHPLLPLPLIPSQWPTQKSTVPEK